jgi:hypothetical protein
VDQEPWLCGPASQRVCLSEDGPYRRCRGKATARDECPIALHKANDFEQPWNWPLLLALFAHVKTRQARLSPLRSVATAPDPLPQSATLSSIFHPISSNSAAVRSTFVAEASVGVMNGSISRLGEAAESKCAID